MSDANPTLSEALTSLLLKPSESGVFEGPEAEQVVKMFKKTGRLFMIIAPQSAFSRPTPKALVKALQASFVSAVVVLSREARRIDVFKIERLERE